MGKRKSDELAQELQQHRADQDEWEEEATPIEVRSNRSAVVSFRVPHIEFEALEAAAAAVGESISEYIRKAVGLRQGGNMPLVSSVNYTVGNVYLQINGPLDEPTAWSIPSANAGDPVSTR